MLLYILYTRPRLSPFETVTLFGTCKATQMIPYITSRAYYVIRTENIIGMGSNYGDCYDKSKHVLYT